MATNRLHNYTTLANGGEKIDPTALWPEGKRRRRGRPRVRSVTHDLPKLPRGRPRKPGASVPTIVPATAHESPVAPTPAQVCTSSKAPKILRDIPRLCDNPLKEDSCGIQQKDLYGAARDVALCRGGKEAGVTPLSWKLAEVLWFRTAIPERTQPGGGLSSFTSATSMRSMTDAMRSAMAGDCKEVIWWF